MRSLLLTSVDASRTKRTAGNHRFKIISQCDEGVKIKSFLIIVGAIITVACPVAKAAEEDDQQKQEPKTYERCVLAASKRIQSGLSTESMSITAELNSVYQVSTNLLVSFGELPRKI